MVFRFRPRGLDPDGTGSAYGETRPPVKSNKKQECTHFSGGETYLPVGHGFEKHIEGELSGSRLF